MRMSYQQLRTRIRLARSARYRRKASHAVTPATDALRWIREHESPTGGIRVHSQCPDAYPEVTGYIVPTLLTCGEKTLAERLVRWLIAIQRPDGAYTDPTGTPTIFDTGQVLRGLLAGIDLHPATQQAARRAAECLCAQAKNNGHDGFGRRYPDQPIQEPIHLYALPPLVQATDVLDQPRYRRIAENCLEHYLRDPDALRVDHLTHFLAYELDALIDLGRQDMAMPVLAELESLQWPDGAVRGHGNAAWVCTPGLAQLAICWYKLGRHEPADRAVAWLERHQEVSGGFRGSYGRWAAYFAKVEPAWAAKFYLDAHRYRVLAFFERNVDIFPENVSADDGRAQAILACLNSHDRVLEVGCGKGRFLKAVRQARPDASCTGVDISPALLAAVPGDIETLPGALEAIPCADEHFDVAFSVEAIEHAINPHAAIAEMVRVVRPGGWVVVIDKQRAAWGRMPCPAWERWPAIDALKTCLGQYCDDVTAEPVAYDDRPAADGLMVVWRGRKRSAVSVRASHAVLTSEENVQDVVKRVRHNRLSEWAQVIMLATSPGQEVLEVGSGTGEISLLLAQGGRNVTMLDYSPQCLAFSRTCADRLGLSVRTVRADATQPLPFGPDAFQCVFSAGLLEHFSSAERRRILQQWAAVTSDKIVTLVPNAACVAYQVGKQLQERQGTWPYGLETPIRSMREDLAAAGLHLADEFTVGVGHAFTFLPAGHALRRALSDRIDDLSHADQGYLLVTIAAKPLPSDPPNPQPARHHEVVMP